VTTIEKPSEAYAAACKVMGPERVYVPALLNIATTGAAPKGTEKRK
jgi:hypothetical protein